MSKISKRVATLKLTSQKDVVKHETAARTFGELKAELADVNWKARVIVKEGRQTLQLDDALLPAGDFVLFVVPEKVKSGLGKNKEGLKKLKDVDGASYNDLRSHGSYLNNAKNAKLDLSGGTEQLRAVIKAYYGSDEEVAANDFDPIAEIENARAKINETIDKVIDIINSRPQAVEDTTEYLIKVSVDDLDEELQEIKRALKL